MEGDHALQESKLSTLNIQRTKHDVPANTLKKNNNTNGYSQCETECDEEDEEMTEEENEFEEKGSNARNDDGNETEASSACNSDSTEEVPLSQRSLDIQDLIERMPYITNHYHILSKIGEGNIKMTQFKLGTFSSVYKAVDLLYDHYENTWDSNWSRSQKWTSPPIKKRDGVEPVKTLRKYVALKKIYVTSSPIRVYNELELLHQLRSSCAQSAADL
jgi:cell division control protein 7